MSADVDGASLILPLVYDVGSNVTQLAERRDPSGGGSSHGPVAQTASMMLKRFNECGHMMGMQPGDCSIFPAVRDLLTNLTLPNEPPAMAANQVAMQQAQQQPSQMVPMGMGSGPGMGNMVPGNQMSAMQMQGGPMGMGGVMPQQVQPQGQVAMPIHSPYGQPQMNANPMTPVMSMGPMSGNMGPGSMQMQ